MLVAAKDTEEKKKPGEILAWEEPVLLQDGTWMPAAGTCPKQRIEKSEQPFAAIKQQVREALYQGLKTLWVTNVGKATEAKDLLLPARVNVVQGSKWKVR